VAGHDRKNQEKDHIFGDEDCGKVQSRVLARQKVDRRRNIIIKIHHFYHEDIRYCSLAAFEEKAQGFAVSVKRILERIVALSDVSDMHNRARFNTIRLCEISAQRCSRGVNVRIDLVVGQTSIRDT